MAKFSSALSIVLAATLLASVPEAADARRLGGGKAAGMQRQAPAKPADATPATPAQPAQPGQAAVAPKGAAAAGATSAAAAAGKRSWLGPIAGIAAGLGIAALMSHLGLGEAFGNFLTMALLAIVAIIAIRWLMGRFRQPAAGRSAGPQLAGAGAPLNEPAWRDDRAAPMQRQAMAEPAAAAFSAAPVAAQPASVAQSLPAFDSAAFERVAKMIFVRLQAANDAADVEDLRKFTTPELFASLRLDLQDRGAAAQQTDVVQLAAEVVEATQEADQHIVSVRFHGLIREEIGGTAEPFEEIWHLVRPADGQREWAIAGISPVN